MTDRNAVFQWRQQRSRVRQGAQQTAAVDLFNLLTGPELLEVTDSHLPKHRERLYPPTVTLAMFMKQALTSDPSCQQAVNAWAAQRAVDGLSVRSIATGGYCQARQRLPLGMVTALTRETGRLLSTRAQPGWRWRGRPVKLVDGTEISMPDTADNQTLYPQPSTQAEGVGFPLMRLVGILCLSTGAVLDTAIGPHAGKGSTELDLFRRLLGQLSTGDVLLADALYCSYFMIAQLQAAGVDVLFEQHGARITDFRRGQRLGTRDHVVRWLKPRQRPNWMSVELYQAAPKELTVREAKVNGRVLVTTLLDARQVCKDELDDLYAHRWHVELDFRNIKTTLGLHTLRCLSPQMAEKELWVYLLAYNLVRLLMAQAAQISGVHPRELSFKHTVQMWRVWSMAALRADPISFFRLIAQRSVGNRPGRIEPRARKRRPKSYPLLKVPRTEARRQIRNHAQPPCA